MTSMKSGLMASSYGGFSKRKYKTMPSSYNAANKRRQLRLMSCFIVVVFVGIMMAIIAVDVIFVTWDKQRRNELLYSSDYVIEEQPQWTMVAAAPEVPVITTRSSIRQQLMAQGVEFPPPPKPRVVRTEPPPIDYGGLDHWQRVRGYSHKFFVFSAYYDDRNEETVRIIAVTYTKFRDLVRCRLFYEGSNSSLTSDVDARAQVIRENWQLRYSAFFLTCKIDHGRIPSQVSVIPPAGRETNRLKIHVHEDSVNHEDRSRDFAVCVKPIHFGFDNHRALVEFIEFNRLLGVDHFIFYNHSMGHRVNCLLHSYVNRGLATVLPWNLDVVSQKEIRTEGQFAAWNDCMYRVMNRYKYAVMIDMDELIVPHQHDNLADMIDAINRLPAVAAASNRNEKIGAFSFMNNFFYQTWPDDAKYSAKNSSSENQDRVTLVSLRKTRRKKTFTRHKIRSKCIVMPLHVVEMGNHFVWDFQSGYGTFNVPHFFGFSHHYRHVCEFGGTDCLRSDSVVDNRTHHWSDPLLRSYSQVFEKYKCHLPQHG